MKRKTIQAKVSERYLERVDKIADYRGMSRSEFLRYALEKAIQETKNNKDD
ncbi:MAG: ribbon-helix-helix protein, CopG family [archaeon]